VFLVAGSHVPEPGSAVLPSGKDLFAVCRKDDTVYRAGVPPKDAAFRKPEDNVLSIGGG
jgi:hypothetical protein